MGVFDEAQVALQGLFGASEALPSGNGVRFRSASRGSITLYSKGISDGNLAELAFGTKSISKVTGLSEADVFAQIRALAHTTRCPVTPHAKFQWPRVGLSSTEHVEQVLAGLAHFYN